ncbi:response regulator transcription factor [Nonomuraea sp. NPDC050663]|uniref:response regulator transcription factor n=1 Tax=Nonomuraea sp. NPDC050663 TaxID=3364370 RepID=UPI00379C3BC3
MATVLIVDDQRPFRSVARALVGALPGWRVLGEAETGHDAVAQALAVRPAVVLMDIHLPDISGIEATRLILAAAPATKVVLVSSYAVDDLPPDALSCGAVRYIRKDDLSTAQLRDL